MRLLIVGGLNGQIGAATKIAMDRGAKVTHAISIEQALDSLRGGGSERSEAAIEAALDALIKRRFSNSPASSDSNSASHALKG